MGAWDDGPFDSDAALDWAGDLRESDEPHVFLRSLVTRFLTDTENGYDESLHRGLGRPAQEAMACAAVLLLLASRETSMAGFRTPKTVQRWLGTATTEVPSELLRQCLLALGKVEAARSLDGIVCSEAIRILIDELDALLLSRDD